MAKETDVEFCLEILVGEKTITSRFPIEEADFNLRDQTLLEIARGLWATDGIAP